MSVILTASLFSCCPDTNISRIKNVNFQNKWPIMPVKRQMTWEAPFWLATVLIPEAKWWNGTETWWLLAAKGWMKFPLIGSHLWTHLVTLRKDWQNCSNTDTKLALWALRDQTQGLLRYSWTFMASRAVINVLRYWLCAEQPIHVRFLKSNRFNL